jgi:hypothetical protein
VRPAAAEGLCGGGANAGARAGDENGLISEFFSLNHRMCRKRFLF